MLTIQDNVIKMTKGDTGMFSIDVYTPDNKFYTLKEQDKITFYLFKTENNCFCECYQNIEDNKIALKKEFKSGIIILDSNDTRYLKYGEYFWKCVLEYNREYSEDNKEESLKEKIVNTIASGRFFLNEI